MSYFEIAGPSQARAIVFLHGMRVTRRMWQPQFRLLAQDYRVIAVDLPGHGSQRDVVFSWELAVRQIAEVVDREAAGRALIVGISLGGYMAMEFGASHPEKTSGLVVASATVEPSGWYNFPYRFSAVLMDRAPEPWLNWMSCTFFEAFYRDGRAEPLIAPGFYMRGGAQALREVFQRKFLPKLASYDGSVLFLNGARDFGFRLQEAKFLAAARHGRLEVIPQAYHLVNIDQPGAFSNSVRRFADSLRW